MSADKDPVDRMVDAYDNMVHHVHDAAERVEKRTLPWLQSSLEEAQEKAVELNELTREEIEKVASYVERDLHEAAHYISDTGNEFQDWLRFDKAVVQSRVLDAFATMADHTSEALKQFSDQARLANTYFAGEITSPGVLQCSGCGEEVTYKKTRRISPCPNCNGDEFMRVKTRS